MRHTFAILLTVLTLGSFAAAESFAAPFTLLHSFTGGKTDGGTPSGSLIINGPLLYGLTDTGGQFGYGTAFNVTTTGANFTLLHSFADGLTDGAYPLGSLIQSGSQLYGLTNDGGSANPNVLSPGVVFGLGATAAAFNLMHVFNPATEGDYPFGSLTDSNGMLYGMTEQGGDDSDGTIFNIPAGGGALNVLYSFSGGTNDGANPYGSLISSGGNFYGMTQRGGSNNYGTVFQYGQSGLTILHSFLFNDGVLPQGSLALDGSTLYGMTVFGGTNNQGTIFAINLDGSDFRVLHDFSGGDDDGAIPNDSLTISGSTIYGMTASGGADNDGVVFDLNLDGSDFSLLHSFTGTKTDGASPQGSLTISNSTLYGMTEYGGKSDDGVIFSIALPEPSTSAILLPLAACAILRPRRNATQSR